MLNVDVYQSFLQVPDGARDALRRIIAPLCLAATQLVVASPVRMRTSGAGSTSEAASKSEVGELHGLERLLRELSGL